MKLLSAVWSFFGRADLTFYLLLILVVDLCGGFFTFRAHPELFGPLDRLQLLDWIVTYGRFHLDRTWWFFVFMILMSLLVLNTLVCTYNRVAALVRRRRESPERLDYLLRFSPHLMHLAFVVLLLSMLASYLGGVNLRNNVVRAGGTIALAGTDIKLRLDGIKVDFYQGRRLSFYQGRAMDQDLSLTFIDGRGRETTRSLGINRPVWYRGYSVHIKKYQPQSESRAKRPGWANLIVRRDPGVRIFFAGVGLFILGLAGYLVQSLRKRSPAGKKE